MGALDLAVKSLTVAPNVYTATFTGNYTNYVASNITMPVGGYLYTPPPYASPPEADAPEKWLRRRVKEVCELAAAGAPIRAIAREYGVWPSTIRQRLARSVPVEV